MNRQEPNPASAKDPAEGSRENVNLGADPSKRPDSDFERKTGLDGRTDSGPEPDVHGQEIPPQE